MQKNWSINQKKKYLVELLNQSKLISFPKQKIMELLKILHLDLESMNSKTPDITIKQQIAAWVIQNYSLIKTNIQGYFVSNQFKTVSEDLRMFLIVLVKNYSRKINQQSASNINPIMNPNMPYNSSISNQHQQLYNQKSQYYPPPYTSQPSQGSTSYMYPNHPYMMNQNSMMYMPNNNYNYGNNNEQFEKMYRQQLQYYMQMQQMSMGFPSYMQGGQGGGYNEEYSGKYPMGEHAGAMGPININNSANSANNAMNSLNHGQLNSDNNNSNPHNPITPPNVSNRLPTSPPNNFPSNPINIPSIPSINQNPGYKLEIYKGLNTKPANTKDSTTTVSAKSMEDYEESYKRYSDLYGKKLSTTQAPFIIIPPNRQKLTKNRIPQTLSKGNTNNSTSKNKLQSKRNQKNQQNKSININNSSDLQVLQIPNLEINSNKNKSKEQFNIEKQKKQGKGTLNRNSIFKDRKQLSESIRQLSNCLCEGYIDDPNTFVCEYCEGVYHYDCLQKKKKQEQGNQMEIEQQNKNLQNKLSCPFCFMKQIDPLNQVIKTVKQRYLDKISEKKIMETCNFQNLDSYIIAKLSPYQIELRCMRLEDASNQVPEYTWPDQCLVTLNGDKSLEFLALQFHSSVKKRKDSSVFLTYKIFHDNKNMHQRMNSKIGIEIKFIAPAQLIQKKIRNNFTFIFGIYLTRKKTVQELYTEVDISQKNKVNFARNYFNVEEQQEVAIEQIKVSLLDPFSWNLIETPSRGIKCTHGQCFDLKTYLSFMNIQKNRIWKCPICSKQCRKFLIDLQQQEAIAQYKKHKQSDNSSNLAPQVTFHRDGRTLFSANHDSDDEMDLNKEKQQKNKGEIQEQIREE